MTSTVKKKMDFIPLIILFVSASYLMWTFLDGQILFIWKHYLGFLMLVIVSIGFLLNHKIGVLISGLTIILGLFGLLSFSPTITTTIFGIGEQKITLLRFQPIFVLWATIHFILSGRYYVGIVNKKYWEDISSDETFKIP